MPKMPKPRYVEEDARNPKELRQRYMLACCNLGRLAKGEAKVTDVRMDSDE
jgi:hypothetical protein